MGGNFRVSFLEVALIMVIVLVMASFTPFGTEVPAFNDGSILPMDDGEAVSVGLSDTNVDAGSGYENSGNSYTYPGVYVPGSGRFIFVDGSEEISVRLDEISDILNRCLEFLETEYATPHDSMLRMSDLVYTSPPPLYERLKRSDKAEIERIKERMAKRERERDLVIDIQKLIEKLEIIRGER